MTARVLTCLYVTDGGSLTATEFAQRLQVSPASVSKAVGGLEQQELIRRERDTGRRRDRYVIDADAWLRGWMASARQNTMPADFALRVEHVGRATIQAAGQWRQDDAARRGTPD